MKRKLLILACIFIFAIRIFCQNNFANFSYSPYIPQYPGSLINETKALNRIMNERYKENYNEFNRFYNSAINSLPVNKNTLEYRAAVYAINRFYENMNSFIVNEDWEYAYNTLESSKTQYYIDLNEYPKIEEKQIIELNNKAEVLTKKANELYSMKLYSSSLTNYNKALEIAPVYPDALYGRATLYIMQKSLKLAMQDLNLLIEYYPEIPDGYNLRAYLYELEGNKLEAIEDYSSSLAIENNEKNFAKRGWIYLNIGDYYKALSDFNKQVLLNSTNPIAFYNRGTAKSELNDYEGAKADYLIAIKLNPKFSMAYNNLGWAKFEQKDYNGALLDLNRAISLDSTNSVAFDSRAEVKYKLNNFSGAIKDCSKALQLNPNISNSYYIRGKARLKLNDKNGACEDFQKALDLGKYEANEMIINNCKQFSSVTKSIPTTNSNISTTNTYKKYLVKLGTLLYPNIDGSGTTDILVLSNTYVELIERNTGTNYWYVLYNGKKGYINKIAIE